MATERCPQCGRGLRDGECTHPDCGYVPGPQPPARETSGGPPPPPDADLRRATAPDPHPARPPDRHRTPRRAPVGGTLPPHPRRAPAIPAPRRRPSPSDRRDLRLSEGPSGGARGRRAGRNGRPTVNRDGRCVSCDHTVVDHVRALRRGHGAAARRHHRQPRGHPHPRALRRRRGGRLLRPALPRHHQAVAREAAGRLPRRVRHRGGPPRARRGPPGTAVHGVPQWLPEPALGRHLWDQTDEQEAA